MTGSARGEAGAPAAALEAEAASPGEAAAPAAAIEAEAASPGEAAAPAAAIEAEAASPGEAAAPAAALEAEAASPGEAAAPAAALEAEAASRGEAAAPRAAVEAEAESPQLAPALAAAIGAEAAAPARATPLHLPRSRPRDRAYELHWEVDAPIFAISAVLAYGRTLRAGAGSEAAHCLSLPEGCDPQLLNPLDRPFAGTYSTRWSRASDAATGILILGPALLLSLDADLLSALNDSVVIYEAAFLGNVLAGVSTQTTSRARPYVYGDEAPADLRLTGEGALSFFSGHTAFSFALATSTFWTYRRRHPESAAQWSILGGGLAVAGLVGFARIEGGSHFPTDVLAGALVGLSIGTLVPFLHDLPLEVEVLPGSGGRSLALGAAF